MGASCSKARSVRYVDIPGNIEEIGGRDEGCQQFKEFITFVIVRIRPRPKGPVE